MSFRNWLLFIGLIIIIGLIFDALRRLWNLRRAKNSLKLEVNDQVFSNSNSDIYIDELPNGGARLCSSSKTKDTIDCDTFYDNELYENQDNQESIDVNPEKEKINQQNIIEEHVEDEVNDNLTKESNSALPITSVVKLKKDNDSKDNTVDPQTTQHFLPKDPKILQNSKGGDYPLHLIKTYQSSFLSNKFSAKLRQVFHQESGDMDQIDEHKYTQTYENNHIENAQQDENINTEEFLVVHIEAKKNKLFAGNEVLRILMDHDLRLGEMDIFHYIQPLTGKYNYKNALFSIVNGMEPGYFDLKTMRSENFKILSVIMNLQNTQSPIATFKTMISVIDNISKLLDACVCDEHHCIMTLQMLEYYREKASNYQRAQLISQNIS